MIERYTLPEIGKIWSEENKFNLWLKIEIYACEALAKKGYIPSSVVDEIKQKASFTIDRIKEIEKDVKHDVIAFIMAVNENIGEASKYIHFGLTSSDLLDTTLSIQMKESADMILSKLKELAKILKEKAKEHMYTIMIGRTHGVHAEPITLGFKFAVWYEEIERNIKRLSFAKEMINYGKISGPVGTYSSVSPYVEKYVCEKLGIKPAPISTQILQRDRHAQFLTTLAILASSLEKFATEIRHLQKTEVLELEEPFSQKQKGSSAMPHKRNPIICERICGLARVVRANAFASLENINLWHERDISHSSAERIIIPDAIIAIYYMVVSISKVIENLSVYKENMLKNLGITKGAIFSQKVMLALIEKGLSREEAYKIVQENAMKCLKLKKELKTLLMKDNRIKKLLTKNKIEECFKIEPFLKHIPEIIRRTIDKKIKN
jgi:adenylosuccinate lyase